MAKINVGDTVYIRLDWPDRQIRGVVVEVGTSPNFPKRTPRLRRYMCRLDDDEIFSTGHTRYQHGKGNVPVVRKTPWPQIPFGKP